MALEKLEDDLAAGELEGEIGRHAGQEILGLMMDDHMDIAEADAQKAMENLLGERYELLGIDLERA